LGRVSPLDAISYSTGDDQPRRFFISAVSFRYYTQVPQSSMRFFSASVRTFHSTGYFSGRQWWSIRIEARQKDGGEWPVAIKMSTTWRISDDI